jgi:hypothetical protein
MSPSWSEPFAYWRERFPSTLFVPVALFLAIPALPEGTAAAAKSALVAYLLVFQFRLWDDLCDRTRPRALVPFYVVLAALAAVLVLLTFDRAIVYLAVLVSFALWYQWIAPTISPVFGYHVVLSKYALFAYLAASAGVVAMALVYVTFLCYEPLHDRGLRLAPVATAAILSWVVLIALSISVLIAVPAGTVAAFALWQVHRGEDGTLAGRVLFSVSFVAMLFSTGAFS